MGSSPWFSSFVLSLCVSFLHSLQLLPPRHSFSETSLNAPLAKRPASQLHHNQASAYLLWISVQAISLPSGGAGGMAGRPGGPICPICPRGEGRLPPAKLLRLVRLPMLESEEKLCPLECPILLVLPWRMCPARECERSKPDTRFFLGDGGGGMGTGMGGGPMDPGALEGWVWVAIGMVGALRPRWGAQCWAQW